MKARAEASGEQASGPPPMNFKSVEAGAATGVWAATAAELESHGGAYLADCEVGSVGGDTSETGVEPHAADPKAAERLWRLSEEWVGDKFAG